MRTIYDFVDPLPNSSQLIVARELSWYVGVMIDQYLKNICGTLGRY